MEKDVLTGLSKKNGQPHARLAGVIKWYAYATVTIGFVAEIYLIIKLGGLLCELLGV